MHVCVCSVEVVKEKRPEAGREGKKNQSEVQGFVSTAEKSAESGENSQHQRDCVRADARYSPVAHCVQKTLLQ